MLRAGLSNTLHVLVEAAVGVLGLAAIAACVLAWRLAQGPIDVTGIARREQAALSGPGTKIAIGRAAIAWEGFRRPDRALDLRVHDVSVTAPNGALLAQVPDARVTLAIAPLLLGRIVPRTLDLQGPRAFLRREADGSLQLDIAPNEPVPSPQSAPSQMPAGGGGGEILRELAQPANANDLPWLSQLTKIAVAGGQFSVRDAVLGVVWQAPQAKVDLKRLPGGGVTGQARLDFAVGAVRATLAVQAELRADGTHVTATSTAVSPAALARASDAFAGLSAVDAPVQAALDAQFDASLVPVAGHLSIEAGAGTVRLGRGSVGVETASLAASASADGVRVSGLRIAFAALDGSHAKPPVVTGHAQGKRQGGRIAGGFDIAIDGVAMTDLGRYWPMGVGGGARAWLVRNVTGGQAHDAHVEGTLDAAPDFSDVAIGTLSGGLDGDGLEVSWLRPIPPVERGRVHLVVDGPDALHIVIANGAQGALAITDGVVKITGLSAPHQVGNIEIGLQGGLAEALHLLDHPRLKLLSRRNLDLTDPSGDVTGRLKVRLPLEDNVSLDDIAISAHAALADVHIGNVAASRALDDAQLVLDVDSDGLKLGGEGVFASIPAKLALDMDFRMGPPNQMLEHMKATGTATAAELAKAGLPATIAANVLQAGTAGLTVEYSAWRNGAGTVACSADLAASKVATPIGWSKPAGAPADIAATLLLSHGKLVGIDRIHAEGPGLKVAGHADMQGGRTRALALDTIELGQTRAAGRIDFAESPAEPVRLSLSGPMLDLSDRLDKPAANAKDAPAVAEPAPEAPRVRGQPWQANLDFDVVLLAKNARIGKLTAKLANDGLDFSSATIRAGGTSGVRADIVPEPGGRRVSLDAPDAGTVLAALGIADNLRGGRLQMEGRYDDTKTPPPLSGTATLSEFNLTDAPAIGRLLQAMTLYGLTDLLRGPGLHFSKLVAPFNWKSRVLHLDESRAFSSSLGLTASGDIDLGRRTADVQGTVVPAYFFNQLPGKLPLIGRLFAPEKGGGLFAARYSVTGKLGDPTVSVNPLSALTPGVLRNLFGLFSGK